MTQQLRPYVILVQDARNTDTTVWSGWAESPTRARQLIYDIYIEQGWPLKDIKHIDAHVIRAPQQPYVTLVRQIAGPEPRVESETRP